MRTILRTCSRKGNLYLSLNAVSLLLPRFKSSSLGKGDKVTEFKVDRSGLIDFKLPSMPSAANTPSNSSTESVAKESTTPLGRDLYSYILAKGPITVHEFMTQAANHSEHGYYQNKIGQIGARGDFITAPEISQLFGEMVGLWLVANWQAMGSPPRVNIVELGPGNGVLMRDVLKTLKKFPALQKAMEIHLVELSQRLRHVQAATITGSAPSDPATSHNDQPFAQIEYDGCKISWHPFFSEVPKDVPLFVIAQVLIFRVYYFIFMNLITLVI